MSGAKEGRYYLSLSQPKGSLRTAMFLVPEEVWTLMETESFKLRKQRRRVASPDSMRPSVKSGNLSTPGRDNSRQWVS